MNGDTRPVGVVGVGYQQRPVEEFVSDLARMGVAVVVDVRLTPISRRPGFSKTGLARALAGAGIGYEHRPELGNPKANRAGFAGSAEELAAARAVYRGLLDGEKSSRALAEIAELGKRHLVALSATKRTSGAATVTCCSKRSPPVTVGGSTPRGC